MQSLIAKNLEVLIFDDPIDEYAFSKIKNYEKFLFLNVGKGTFKVFYFI
jgi:HSP90 family molecular chaperone